MSERVMRPPGCLAFLVWLVALGPRGLAAQTCLGIPVDQSEHAVGVYYAQPPSDTQLLNDSGFTYRRHASSGLWFDTRVGRGGSTVRYTGSDADGSYLAEVTYPTSRASVDVGGRVFEWRRASLCLGVTTDLTYGNYETVSRRRLYYDAFGRTVRTVDDEMALEPSRSYLGLEGGAVAGVGVGLGRALAVGASIDVVRTRQGWSGQAPITWSGAAGRVSAGMLLARVLFTLDLTRPLWLNLDGAEPAGTSFAIGVAYKL